MFCPSCKCEFRPSFTRCASCDVDLVEDLSAGTPEPEALPEALPAMRIQMAEICGFLDLGDARQARDLLHENRIPSELVIRVSPDTPPDGAVVEEYWLQADAQQLRQVQALLRDDPAPHVEDNKDKDKDEGGFACSKCGVRVRKEESFCANCGTRFSE